ncbi:MAG: carboxypeptidase regulatory-like domain-containing protein [Leadbetterella sp.]
MSKLFTCVSKGLSLFVFLLVSLQSYSQVTTSSIAGSVSDAKGEKLPGATITAVHVPSGTKYAVVSNVSGRYVMPAVRVGGPYKITTTFVGFKETIKEELFASLGSTLVYDIVLLDESTVLQEVVVKGNSGSAINSERTGASSNFKKEAFERLPSISRSFTDLSALTPQAGGGFSFGGRSNQYNNFSIDGATSNNVFGLSSLPGGQSNAQPISLDAIQEMNVSLAPYDVSQGSFTGAGVNAVTRSGTNTVQGSAYYFFKNQNLTNDYVGKVKSPLTDFSNKNFGFRLGGPIIKDKVFFFINAERESGVDPAVLFPADGKSAEGVAYQQTKAELDALKDFLIKTGPNKDWTFDPGTYENFDLLTSSNKFLGRVDWNINLHNKFSIRYNQMNSFRDVPPSNSGGPFSAPTGGRQNSNNAVPFSSAFYRINNNLSNVIAELNSSGFGSKLSNNFQIGYSAFRDFREGPQGDEVPNFPLVDILGPNGNVLTSFGAEPFSANNRLNQDIFQINDKLDFYLNKHTITLGTANEFYTFYNSFTQLINGNYIFNSSSDFVSNVSSPAPANFPDRTTGAGPRQYGIQYIGIPGSDGAADWKAQQYGFYIQDKFVVSKRLNLTYGVRMDIPGFNGNNLLKNVVTDSMTFANGEKINVDVLPKATPLFSPRIGFNLDVFGDKKLQLRGGTGVFTGRIPFVWISNQISNNGLYFGQYTPSTAALGTLRFSNDPNKYVPTLPEFKGRPLSPTYAINSTVPDFKFPQVWRSNFAADYQINPSYVATAEFIYTKDLNAIYIRDANLAAPVGTVAGDGRLLYGATSGSSADRPGPDRRLNDPIVNALVLDNINKGYSTQFTVQLQKVKGLIQGNIAYTYTDSKDINGQSGSTAGGLFTGNQIVNNPNDPNLGYANNWNPHRVVGFLSYNKILVKNLLGISASVIYQGFNNSNFSYTYQGSVNSDGINNNDLIYVPRNASEIVLIPTDARDTRSTAEIWNQLDAYITQDKYLNSRRGQYAERNGALAPWVNRLNTRVLIDLFHNFGKNKNTLQFSWETSNFLNLLNKEWGLAKIPARSGLIGLNGYETPNTAASPATGRPVMTFATNSDGSPLNASYINNTTLSSRWQMQFGFRYIFN